MSMRPSRVLSLLRQGKNVCCYKLNFSDARATELVAICGFDCIWIDMEHVPNDFSSIEQSIWAAKSQNVDVMVRVARGGYSDYIRPLEADAAGIMVPHVMSLEDAKQVVRTTRFHPIGRRPLDGGNADGGYCEVALETYIREANEQRFVAIQIEDPEPLDELDRIAALPGIDMLFFGPADFSQGIGAPGSWEHPKLIDTRKRIVELARTHGKFAGTVASPANMDTLAEMGYQFLNLGADVHALAMNCKSLVAQFKKEEAGSTKSIYGGK
ncbi:MAG: aldolase [Lentisphaerae bacterium GWF2_52_8]|nr:MAG: aldolase [Lentisphaerae bacterium GWF2_52_8]